MEHKAIIHLHKVHFQGGDFVRYFGDIEQSSFSDCWPIFNFYYIAKLGQIR